MLYLRKLWNLTKWPCIQSKTLNYFPPHNAATIKSNEDLRLQTLCHQRKHHTNNFKVHFRYFYVTLRNAWTCSTCSATTLQHAIKIKAIETLKSSWVINWAISLSLHLHNRTHDSLLYFECITKIQNTHIIFTVSNSLDEDGHSHSSTILVSQPLSRDFSWLDRLLNAVVLWRCIC